MPPASRQTAWTGLALNFLVRLISTKENRKQTAL